MKLVLIERQEWAEFGFNRRNENVMEGLAAE